MRYSGDWMALVDDRILEYIQEQDSGSPTEMKREGPIYYSRQYIDQRCRRLAEEGLLEHLGNGVYVITELGEAYLDGDYDTQNWEWLTETDADTPSMPDDESEVREG